MTGKPLSTLYELFLRTVETTPEGLALEIGAQRLTYAQLNSLARRVAAAILRTETDAPVVAFMAHKSAPCLSGGPRSSGVG